MQAHNLCRVGLVLCVHGKDANKRLHKKIHTYTDVCPITFRTKHAMVKKTNFHFSVKYFPIDILPKLNGFISIKQINKNYEHFNLKKCLK